MLRRHLSPVAAGAGARPALRAGVNPASSASAAWSQPGGLGRRRAFVCRAADKDPKKDSDDIFKSMSDDIDNSLQNLQDTAKETTKSFSKSLTESIDEFTDNIQQGAEGVTKSMVGMIDDEDIDKKEEILGKDDDWVDWSYVKADAWGEAEEETGNGEPVAPKRPRYPGWLSNEEKYRDQWLTPMIDRESLRQRLFMSEEQAAEILDKEAAANAFESQQALKFAALLLGVPLAASWAVSQGVYGPVLHKALESGEAFNLSYMQEVHGAHEIRVEEMRMRMDITIGRAPPLTDDEIEATMRDKALEIQEEMREENLAGLQNLVTDMTTVGIGSLILFYDKEGRTYLFRTTSRVVEGISDLGKAFVIILVADTMVGYHSAEGWEAFISVLAEHWNMEPTHETVSIFVATVPVLMDSLFKLWLFQGFVKGKGGAAGVVTLKAMDRH